ncbi:MAG: PQQ-binding-like beta-propeller repeat protein [bacterium]|nr:PQQ-binding-like beta-propeller repeat protein [bacterium]
MKKVFLIILIFVCSVDLLRSQLADSAWPLYRQNVRRTGWSNTGITGPQKNPVVKWAFSTGGLIKSSAVVGADNTVYFTGWDHKFYAVTNGAVKWSLDLGSKGSNYASFAVDTDGTLYAGSYNSNFYAVTNGNIKWSYKCSNFIRSSAAIGPDQTIYFGSADRKLYALSNNGHLKWAYKTGGEIFSSPAIGADGTIYAGSSDYRLYAITNGALKWRVSTSNYVWSSPLIGPDDTVYFGSYDDKFYAITNGRTNWVFKTGNDVFSSPALDYDSTIYFGSLDRKIYALYPNGTEKWSFVTGSTVTSSPCLGADSTVYIGSWDHSVYAVKDGVLKWSFPTGEQVRSSPALGPDGTLYVGSWDFNMYAIKQNNEPELLWSGNPGFSSSGVSPQIGKQGALFRFEVLYRDTDNDAPVTNMVWIDTNDNGLYEMNEHFIMGPSVGTVFSNGIIYTNSLQLWCQGDGVLNYRFYYKDKYGYKPLACAACTDNIVIIDTNIPFLSWTGGSGYESDGVSPNTNDSGSRFGFAVRYREYNGLAPVTNQVWIDLDDNSVYEANERFAMTGSDASDTVYSDGKDYVFSLPVTFQGDGFLNYRFMFTDNVSRAVGIPCQDQVLKVKQIYQNLENVRVAPNPFKPGLSGRKDYIMFYNLTLDFEIKLFSVTGLEINRVKARSDEGRYRLSPRTKDGKTLKPGVYICRITNPEGQEKTLKLVVIR